jgi:hypothetical protein
MTPQEAVDFFAQQVTRQAEREGAPLTQPEQRMLRWSEVIPGLECSAELNDEFEEVTDSKTFEEKVRELLKRAKPAAGSPEAASWDEALAALRGEDAYILVMLTQAGFARTDVVALLRILPRPVVWVLLLAVAVVIIAAVLKAVP